MDRAWSMKHKIHINNSLCKMTFKSLVLEHDLLSSVIRD
jgi:hypothetical protein